MTRLLALIALASWACSGSASAPPAAAPAAATTSPVADAGAATAIRGTVVDADGAPVADALVALVPESVPTWEIAAMARSDAGGAFAFEAAPGQWGVTATHPDHVAGFHCGVVVADGAGPTGVVIRLGGEGPAIAGRAADADGRGVAGTRVQVSRYSEDACDQFATITGSDGGFAVRVPAATGYTIAVAESDRESAPIGVSGAGADGLVLHTLRRWPAGPAPEEVVAWLRASAIPLATVEAGHGFDDMQPLRAVVGDARIVALGEATHGTREFFQLKHRMLEFLVEEMGFTAFAIEATTPEAFDIDDYVMTGRGDPRAALTGLYFWTWDTEEVLALIEWMRAYNADPAHTRKVRFYGVDMQSAPRAARRALAYLERVDRRAARELIPRLQPVEDPFLEQELRFRSANDRAEVGKAVAELAALLDDRRAAYERRTGADAWALARHHARILEQYMTMLTADDGNAVRDRAMAENVAWVLDREGPDGKIVVWAHNGHVSAHTNGRYVPMGHHLRQRFGDALRVFGFAFERGGFQARNFDPGGDRALHAFELGPAPEGSYDHTLARAGSLFAIDLRSAPPTGLVADWLAARHLTRDYGAGFAHAWPNQGATATLWPASYDAVLFVAQTSAAQPTFDRAVTATPVLDAPANLDFESAEELAGWHSVRWTERFGYALERVAAPGGRHAAQVTRTTAPRYGEASVGVEQRFRAGELAGKRVRVRFVARATPGRRTRHDRVYVYADVLGTPGAHRRVEATAWKTYEVELDVPATPDATVRVGLDVTGDAGGALDEVTIEPL